MAKCVNCGGMLEGFSCNGVSWVHVFNFGVGEYSYRFCSMPEADTKFK